MSTTANINLDQISAKVDQMSPEDLRKLVFDAKVKQAIATKKYYNPEAAKVQRQRRAAEFKAAAEQLKAQPASTSQFANAYEELMAQARETANATLANEQADTENEEL